MRTKLFKMTLTAAFTLAFVLTSFACDDGESLTDKRDNKKYKTVKIGKQVWMAENLNYETEGSKCYGEGGKVYIWGDTAIVLSNNEVQDNCKKYGRLYNWETAMKACPIGWHLPTNQEWDSLYHYADGSFGKDNTESPYESESAGKYLKATSGWSDYKGKSGNGEDKYGFAALPGGDGFSVGSFYFVGDNGYWWSASEYDANLAYGRDMGHYNEYAYCNYYNKARLQSVRCVQD